MFRSVWVLFLFPLLVACSREEPTQSPRFVDVAQTAGLDFVHYNGAQGDYFYVETFGSGAAFLDYDGDGWQDIYLVNSTYLTGLAPQPLPTDKLYRNRGDGRFDAAPGSGDSGYGTGVAAADWDNDGDQDLYVTRFGPNALYRNDAGKFTDSDSAKRAGVDDGRWGASCGFLDYDLDGDLDLFVANYVDFTTANNVVCKRGDIHTYCDPDEYGPTSDLLYRNDGQSQFTDITYEAGITLEGPGLGVAFSDYDWDGDTDIYVANDGTLNFLYENRQTHFVETGLTTGGRYNQDGRAEAGMGVDFGDWDNDGNQDLFVTNFAHETNTLYHNDGQGQFADISAGVGLFEPSYNPLGFGTKFLDVDLDGDLDLFVANGHVLDIVEQIDSTLSYAQTNQILRNETNAWDAVSTEPKLRKFVDISSTLGPSFATPNVGRGAALADYDNDGDLDLLVCSVASPARLLRNDVGKQNHWLLVELVGRQQRDAIGTLVAVTAGVHRQVRERQSGGSYLSSHDHRLHFGLGAVARVDMEVRWPDGTVQTLADVAADQILRLVQP